MIWIAFRCMSQKENKKKYLEEYRVTTWALFECVFYKFAAPCGWLSDRSCGHFGSQPGSYQRNRRGSAICKKRFQKCGVSPFILINISSLVLSDSYMQHYQQINFYYSTTTLHIFLKQAIPYLIKFFIPSCFSFAT